MSFLLTWSINIYFFECPCCNFEAITFLSRASEVKEQLFSNTFLQLSVKIGLLLIPALGHTVTNEQTFEYRTDISKGGWPSVNWLATVPGSASNSLKVTKPTLESLKDAKRSRLASLENQTHSGRSSILSEIFFKRWKKIDKLVSVWACSSGYGWQLMFKR